MSVQSGLSVRVGISLNPFEAEGPDDGARFWSAVEAMEEAGYDSIWLSDSATLGGVAPLPALAAIAARTERLKLGTGVLVVPPRNPVLLAREMATVDALSGGRLLPAGGLGIDMPAEIAAMGVPRKERTGRLEEAIQIIRALWNGEHASFDGRFWSFEDVTLHPKPAKSKLELWLGGRAPAALRRVGRVADGWLGSYLAPDEFAPAVQTIKTAAAQAGRSIDEDHYGTTLFAAPSEEELPPEGRRILERRRELRSEDHIALGAPALRSLLDRFYAEGASKFVVVPIARDTVGWMHELYAEAVGPVEAATG